VTSLTEKAALVTLVRDGHRPRQAYADLIEEAGSATAALAQEQLFEPDAADEIAAWEAEGMRLVSVVDPEYPENLRAVHDRPPFLFIAGQLKREDARSVAVIGSRTASEPGLAAARAIAEHLVQQGFTVTSGLAIGVDTAAHTAALDGGGRTIAVIGTGLRRSYPPENGELQRRIASECAVVSQFWPDDPPTRRTFPMRNAVMSGLSLATVIVEATERSGTRIQARLALAQGRPVFLRDTLLEQDWARELVCRPGAHAFGDAEQITATVERLTATDALVG
jgi:DNA processing protein